MHENNLFSDYLAGRIDIIAIYKSIEILAQTENIFFAHVAGDACMANHDWQKTEFFYRRSIYYGSKKWFTYLNLHKALFCRGSYEEALEILRTFKQDPDWFKCKPPNHQVIVNYFYGLCLYGLGKNVEASDCIVDAIKSSPALAYDSSSSFILKPYLHKYPDFFATMQERLRKYYKSPEKKSRFDHIFSLVQKSKGRALLEAEFPRIRLPKQFYKGTSYQDLHNSLLSSHGNFVVKPSNSADSDCVLLFKDWKEIFTGEEIGKHGFPGYVQKCFEAGRFLNSYTQILAEEYVLDYDESNLIPLDYKAWCFNGLCAYIQVISRNGLKRRWSSCFYDRNGCVVDDPIQCSYEHVKKPLPHDPTFQQYWGNLIEQVESISKYLAHFMRIDFYISKSGPVFGEFTSYPFAGQNYSDKGSKVLNSLFFLLSNGMSEIDAA